jgi:hypothetical protein
VLLSPHLSSYIVGSKFTKMNLIEDDLVRMPKGEEFSTSAILDWVKFDYLPDHVESQRKGEH